MTTASRGVPGWVTATVLVAAIFYAGARLQRDFWDFEVYRTAAIRALHAEPLYRPDDGHYQYKYWPAFALASAPFALLPVEVGKPVWFALSIFILVLLLRRAVTDLPDRRLRERTLLILTSVLVGKFVVIELVNGQTNVLLGFLMVSAVGAARAGRWHWAGALVALSTFVKPYALILLPWLVVSGGAAGVSGFALVLAAGLALPALRYGWSGNVDLVPDGHRDDRT
jgi:hypothetical protein